MKKTCIKCKIEKDESEFPRMYRDKKKKKNPRHSYCILCGRIANKEYRDKNKQKIATKRKENLKKRREETKQNVQNGFSNVDDKIQNIRQRCRYKTRCLINKGLVKKKDYCEVCGKKPERLDCHHARYESPELFITLCRTCHLLIHWHVLNNR